MNPNRRADSPDLPLTEHLDDIMRWCSSCNEMEVEDDQEKSKLKRAGQWD